MHGLKEGGVRFRPCDWPPGPWTEVAFTEELIAALTLVGFSSTAAWRVNLRNCFWYSSLIFLFAAERLCKSLCGLTSVPNI